MNRIAPFDGLEIGPPFRLPFVLTSPFNAPRDYGNGRHEGVDYDIIGQPSNSTEPVLCGYDGVVHRSENNGTAYGHFVVTKHENHGFVFYLWYCHMDKRFVVPGQVVMRGDHVGELGATGGDWGEHVHLNLQVPGHGLAGYVVPDVVDPHPYVKKTPDPQQGIAMAPYFMPKTGDYGDIVILANNWGQGNERQQLQRNGIYSYVTKNSQWERRRVVSTGIYLELDTSPGNDQYYTVDGTAWLPASWNPGQQHVRTETVRFYHKATCQPATAPYTVTNSIRFHALHDSWTSQGGVTMAMVIELQWLIAGQVEETYWYAPGLGLVAWSNREGRKSWATEVIPVGQQGNNAMEHGCYG